jgi:hypothetical protein
MTMSRPTWFLISLVATLGCSNGAGPGSHTGGSSGDGSGGSGTGGVLAPGLGGEQGSGGVLAVGGTSAAGYGGSGGLSGTGGRLGTGGDLGSGGVPGLGGLSGSGGQLGTGGDVGSGGSQGLDGSAGTGGRLGGSGGVPSDAGTGHPGSGGASGSPDAGNSGDSGTAVSYTKDIQPLLKSNCTGCHGGSNPSAGIDLSTYAKVKANASSSNSVIQRGSMPPNGPLSTADKQLFAAWVSAGAPNN